MQVDPQVNMDRRRRRIARVVTIVFFPLIVGLVILGLNAKDLYGTNAPASAASMASPPSTPAAGTNSIAPQTVAPVTAAPATAAPATAAPAAVATEPALTQLSLDFPGKFAEARAVPFGVSSATQAAFLTGVSRCARRIEVLGHTDKKGGERANMLLGMRRADYVRNLLIRNGVDPSRVFTGTAGPREAGSTKTATDRRVTVRCQTLRTPARP